jgi:predicted SAM-dependent methyltransferase
MSLRLEVGCGRKPLKGFKTIDIESYAKPDYLGDFRGMSFCDVEEIQAHHVFEHFGRAEALDVLALWRSWLKVDGKLVVEVPDFEAVCEAFSKDYNTKHRYWLCRHLYGSQEAEWAYHREGYWEDKLIQMFSTNGFEVISIRRNITRGYLPNIIVEAIKI